MPRFFKPGETLRLLLCGFAALCAAWPACAQRYIFREYTQGLANLNITSLVQDKTGYLWVGTQNGLYRYDGTQFQGYGEDQGLPQRMILDLYVSREGTLWVAASTGFFFERRDGQFERVGTSSGVPSLPMPGSVFSSFDSNQVVAVAKNGAVRLRRTKDETWTAEPMHLEGTTIWSALYTADGALWYGCDSDLCRLAGGKTTRLGHQLGLPADNWVGLLLTRSGQLWIRGTFHAGEINPNTLHFEKRDLPGEAVSEAYPILSEDVDGCILTALGPSLAMWKQGHWRVVTEHNGLSRFEIQSLFVDREGSVWIGVVGHGLKRWVGQDRWEGYTAADGLSDDLVWAVMEDRKHRLWIGTESGLDWIPAGQSLPRVWRQPGILTTRVGGLNQTADGSIWMGSASGALVRIDPETLVGTQWKLPQVFSVVVDKHQNIWAATSAGIFEMDADWRHSQPVLVEDKVFGDSRQRFSDLSVDPFGRVWFAADEGLFVRDDTGWHRIDPGNTGLNPDLLTVDQQGYVWTAGASQDLMRLRIDHYRVVEAMRVPRPPLLSEEVVSLLVDDRGWLWVGQDAGLSVFDGQTWRSYTQDDGLIWNDTDSFALTEGSDHSLWIGTSGGLSHLLTPQNAPTGTLRPPAFSKVAYGNKVISNGASVPWGSSSLDVSMALLSFRGTHNAGIRYRLVGGQGSDWEQTRDLIVHFQHLVPGDYTLEAADADQAGHPHSPVATFSFHITPRWWQARDLQLTLALMASVVLIGTWRHRVGALVRQKRHLEAAVKLRTIDLEKEKGELLRTKEQMRHFAEHDDLTGLWNHRIIVDRLRIEVERSRREGLPVSVLLADLDYFKRINDTFGHPAGDQVLREASAIFQRMVRTYDWVGRYGGEEFLLILPGSGHMHARQRAEDLRLAIMETPVKEGEHAISITASFGVASGFPSSHEELIRAADEALYRAKNSGRNCVVTAEIDARKSAIHRVS